MPDIATSDNLTLDCLSVNLAAATCRSVLEQGVLQPSEQGVLQSSEQGVLQSSEQGVLQPSEA